MAAKTGEEAVRRYLRAVHDPSKLVDHDEVQQLQTELAASEDPVQALKLRQRLEEISTPSPEAYEADFVAHAKQWAEAEGISGEAFRSEGVSDAVLRRAGLDGGRGRTQRRRSPRSGGSRRPRVSAEEVRAAVPPRAKFTLADLQSKTQASTVTVRNVVRAMVEEGALERLGPSAGHSGPGRAPEVYRRRSKR